MSEARIWHGGDLDEAQRLFPDAPEPWIDLSTGINPIAYPIPLLPASTFERLPSPAAHRRLESAAAEAYGASHPGMVVAAPGTQILISLMPALWPRSRVAVLSPTYAEHAQAWAKAGHEVAEIGSLAEGSAADIVVLVNPNNPDGRIVGRSALVDIAADLRRQGGWLVVDEAFADFDPDETLVPVLPDNAIVLRSFGKTYGLAGIRLGFAVCESGVAERFRASLGPWAVSGPAIEIGQRALLDRDWRNAAREARLADAQRLDSLLESISGQALRGTTLYRLLESPKARSLFSHLGECGIWVRRFEGSPNRLRFGLPGGGAPWKRLEAAISTFPAVVHHA